MAGDIRRLFRELTSNGTFRKVFPAAGIFCLDDRGRLPSIAQLHHVARLDFRLLQRVIQRRGGPWVGFSLSSDGSSEHMPSH